MDKDIEHLEILPNGKIRDYSWETEYVHREDGPAVEHIHGSKSWYLNGKRHREDGPAVEGFDGFKAWCLNDIYMDFQEWKQEVRQYYETDEDYLLMLLKMD